MKQQTTLLLAILSLLLLIPQPGHAQEETYVLYQSAKSYIDINIKSLDRLNARVAKQQEKLLKRLKRKENRFAAKLKRNDSAAYAKYQHQTPSFDSIASVRKLSPENAAKRIVGRPNAAVDSLKAIQNFVADKIHSQGGADNQSLQYNDKLGQLKTNQNYNDYISSLIGQRTDNLKQINRTAKRNIGGFKGIDKNVYYYKQKLQAFKTIKDDPSKIEDEAMEVLQGQEGFESYLQNESPNSMLALASKGANTSDLEKMGYQTKRQMQEQLQKKFGNDLGGLQQNVSGQINDFKEQLEPIKGTVKNAKQTKQSLKQIQHLDKPSFKVNPMRGLPFWQRIEKQVNWQTTRPTLDGKPAMFQIAAMAGFKHTPKLTYGIGISTAIGLGQNWNNIHFSFQGLGLRSYAEWKWQYGIGAYAGYERMYKQAAFFDNKHIATNEINQNHNTKAYNESVLIGLTKQYQVNDKWNGQLQVLYDVWWKEKGLKSPIVLRIATIKK